MGMYAHTLPGEPLSVCLFACILTGSRHGDRRGGSLPTGLHHSPWHVPRQVSSLENPRLSLQQRSDLIHRPSEACASDAGSVKQCMHTEYSEEEYSLS